MLFVRRRSDIVKTMKNDCAIVENAATTSRATTDYRDMQLSMGRRFRSLKVWFVLRSFGKQLRSDLFTLSTKPQFALNTICISDAMASKMGTDSSSAMLKLYDAVSTNKQLWMSKALINGCVSIRIIAANSNSNLASLRYAWRIDTCSLRHSCILIFSGISHVYNMHR